MKATRAVGRCTARVIGWCTGSDRYFVERALSIARHPQGESGILLVLAYPGLQTFGQHVDRDWGRAEVLVDHNVVAVGIAGGERCHWLGVAPGDYLVTARQMSNHPQVLGCVRVIVREGRQAVVCVSPRRRRGPAPGWRRGSVRSWPSSDSRGGIVPERP